MKLLLKKTNEQTKQNKKKGTNQAYLFPGLEICEVEMAIALYMCALIEKQYIKIYRFLLQKCKWKCWIG